MQSHVKNASLNIKLVFLNGKHFIVLKHCVVSFQKNEYLTFLIFLFLSIEMFYQRKIFFSSESSARLSGK